MIRQILSRLSPVHKRKLRGWYNESKFALIQRFRSYDAAALRNRLREMGIVSGDALLVHSAYGRFLGFQGSPNELIDTFLEAVGTGGNLLMVSMPFTTSMSEYLKSTTVFDVRKTPSKMGLLSETFRRRPGVLRSLHPTHPVLACGPKAEWIVSGHENCSYPCAQGSPFEKLLQLNGKVLFFGVPEFNFTFHHYLEDMVKNDLPFALYEEQPHVVKVIDRLGETRSVKVYAFTKDAISRRRLHILLDELARRGQMIRTRIGNTRMVLVASADTVACTKELARRDVYFFEMA